MSPGYRDLALLDLTEVTIEAHKAAVRSGDDAVIGLLEQVLEHLEARLRSELAPDLVDLKDGMRLLS